MNRFIMEELQRIQLLSNYDNSKTLSEQQISKRERQLNNYYTKNYSNVKQIQTKLQELGLDIGASNPDGILGKSTLNSILFALDLVNAPKDYKRKDGKQTDDEDNQPAAEDNQPAAEDNQTAVVADKSDNETPPNAKSVYTRVDKENSI
jgi:peptidoglycan hydrolase-like protein with peptidoglycan-binding domain